MSEEKAKQRPKLWVREWKVIPGEWRPATEEEVKEFFESTHRIMDEFEEVTKSFEDFAKRMRRFLKKMEEAFEELW